METLEALFPTQDDLVRSCGRHFMESLQLPPADRAPEVYAGASSSDERVRRMVETFFGAYERGADGLDGRPPRAQRGAGAWRSRWKSSSTRSTPSSSRRCARSTRTSSSVASLRALTDLEVWRTLRDQGATPESAVDKASVAVGRWLEAQPAR